MTVLPEVVQTGSAEELDRKLVLNLGLGLDRDLILVYQFLRMLLG